MAKKINVRKTNIPLVLILMALAIYEVKAEPNCEATWISWRREPTDYIIFNGKRINAPKSDTVQHHLILVRSNSACHVNLMELPAYIDERINDTSYSASDGGFKYGQGEVSIQNLEIKIQGKYIKSRYSLIGKDSSFIFNLTPKRSGFVDNKAGLNFFQITDSQRIQMIGKWGMREM